MYACVMGNPLRSNAVSVCILIFFPQFLMVCLSSAVIAWWMLCFHSCPIHSGVKALIWSLGCQLASAYPVCPVALYSCYGRLLLSVSLSSQQLVCFLCLNCICPFLSVIISCVRSLLQAFSHPKIHLVLAWPQYFQVCPVTVQFCT